MADAPRTARAGLSKRTKKPSPVVFTSRPPKRSISARTAWLCSASNSRHWASPSRFSVSVDRDRSVNTRVVKMRSEISLGDLAKSRRPAQSTETQGSSPTTHAS